MSETAKDQLIADKDQLEKDKNEMTTTVATRDATIKDLEGSNVKLAADLKAANARKAELTTTVAERDTEISGLRTAKEKAEKDAAAKTATNRANELRIEDQEANLEEAKAEEKMPTWAIAIIVVIGAVLLLVIAILGVVVSR